MDRAQQKPDYFLAGGPNDKGRYSVDVIVDDDECLDRMFMVADAIVCLPLLQQHALKDDSRNADFELQA